LGLRLTTTLGGAWALPLIVRRISSATLSSMLCEEVIFPEPRMFISVMCWISWALVMESSLANS
jgi:hypothetical protein